ncbi:sensor histidine kinase [Rhabdochromatium marinum]|uniref:sensor histidine kinase n=1 Tax=Rhabdochromatium marinum TaxID=48729 RepID=UPI00190549E6|nr:PAS domain-containing sensor histidine kinase [Rhabdochromatium marinum]MBK1647304.1 hypothetical protein [Rhabdochromatium marinum]
MKPLRRREARELIIPILACVGLLMVSAILAAWRIGVQETELREKFLIETTALAQSLSLHAPEQLEHAAGGRRATQSSPLSRHLERFARFAGYRDIWILVAHEGESSSGFTRADLEADAENGQDIEPLPEVARVLATGQASITTPYRRHGIQVISALAVIPTASAATDTKCLVGVELAQGQWRTAVWGSATLPLVLGGLLTLTFAVSILVVYRHDVSRHQAPTHLRYLEPVLAALTGAVLSIATTAIAYQLEQHFESDRLEWLGSQLSFDLTATLREVTQEEHERSATSATQETAPVMAAVIDLFELKNSQYSHLKMSLDVDIFLLDEQKGARLLDPVTQAVVEATPIVRSLSTTAWMQMLLPVFLGEQALAVRLRAGSKTTLGPPLQAAVATAIIGCILTAVATALVIWLRGRLAGAERLLSQRNADLQRREANFTAITSSMRDAIIMMDDDAKIVYWNPAATTLFGYTEAQAMGEDLHQLLVGLDAALTYHNKNPQAYPFNHSPVLGQLVEVNARHKDGSQVPLELSLSFAHLDETQHVVGVLRDISARKRSQERLVKLNDCLAHLGSDYRENIDRITSVCGEILNADVALYNRLDDNQLVALGRWNAPPDFPVRDIPEGHICYDLIVGNDERVRRCGNQDSSNSINAQSREAFYLGDLSLTPYLEYDAAVRKYDLNAYFGHVVRCGHEAVGSLCVVFKRQRRPSDEEKRLLGILAAALTTEENRHLATRELELSEKRMSLAMRGTGIGIWEYEPETRHLRLDVAMHGLLSLQPLQATRLIDDWILRLLPEDMPRMQGALAQALANNAELDQELRLQRGLNELGYLRVIGSVHQDPNRDSRHVIGVCYDITRRKESEARLLQARDLAEQASRTKTQFLSQVSHELRTPMNAVLGFAQLLDGDPDLSDDQHDSVQEILTSGHHLLKLIDEVLDLAQIESGETDLHVQQIMLAPALEEALTLIRPLASKHELSIGFSSPVELAVAADPFRFKQVLINLLSNAVKYNRPGGTVELEAAAVAGTPEEDEWVRISIRDTGTGIPAEQLSDLFEPFRRLPDAQLSGVEGSGIGLAVVKRLVALMGGDIGVESVHGQGSCFWFELPRQPATEATAPLLRPESATPLLL